MYAVKKSVIPVFALLTLLKYFIFYSSVLGFCFIFWYESTYYTFNYLTIYVQVGLPLTGWFVG